MLCLLMRISKLGSLAKGGNSGHGAEVTHHVRISGFLLRHHHCFSRFNMSRLKLEWEWEGQRWLAELPSLPRHHFPNAPNRGEKSAFAASQPKEKNWHRKLKKTDLVLVWVQPLF
jgi:hypothetical protein